MLGKLLKHEWKGTYRAGCLMLIIIAGVTFAGWLAFQSPMWQSLADEDYNYIGGSFGVNLLDILSVFTLLMYAFMLVGVVLGIMIYLGARFYRTMYTGEGYLTHTLPVTKHQLLVSKILVSGTWLLLVELAVFVSVMALIFFLLKAFIPDDYVWEWSLSSFQELFREIFEELDINEILLSTVTLISTIAGPFAAMIMIFGALSLGQLFTKHRIFMAVVSYGVLMIVRGVVGSAAESIIAAVQYGQEKFIYFDSTMVVNLALNAVLTVALYLSAYLVTSRRLNME